MRQGIRVAVPVTPATTQIDAENAAMKAMQAVGATEIRDFVMVKATVKDRERWGTKPLKVFTATAIREASSEA